MLVRWILAVVFAWHVADPWLAAASCCDGCVPAVGGMAGPEDIELDTASGAGPRLIVSAMERRDTASGTLPDGLWAFPLEGRELGAPSPLALEADGCPLRPHGISFVPDADPPLLAAVVHGHAEDEGPRCALPRGPDGAPLLDRIALFRVNGDGSLVLERLLADPLLRHPNDVAAVSRTDVFVTNTPGTSPVRLLLELLHLTVASVVHWDGSRWTVAARGVRFANGILATSDTVYVAGSIDQSVQIFARTGDGLRRTTTVAIGSGVDNLTWAVDEHGRRDVRTLLVAAHPDACAFRRHARDPAALSPSEVYRMDLASQPPGVTRILRGSAAVRAASVGLVYRSRLYMGQVFDPGVVQCDCDCPVEH